MADWKGRGKGRPGDQANPSISGGKGRGSGRPGNQPTMDISGGAGRGGGRPGNQPNLSITGGKGRGQGRPGSQPNLGARVDFGGLSLNIKAPKIALSRVTPRGSSSIGKAANAESNPRVADPEGAFIFALEIDKVEVAQFREANGLKSTTAVFELEEGGMNHRVHKLPGQSRWDNIVLRYGVSSDTSLLKWRNEILDDAFGNRRNGSIVMKTLGGEEVRRYNFVQGWPVAWEGPSFNAESADLAVEMVEIAHHGIQIT